MRKFSILSKLVTTMVLVLLSFTPALSQESECIHPNGQTYKEHWNACGWSLYFEFLRRQAAESRIWQFGCDERASFSSDGSLWKPESDNTGKPVVLLPAIYWELAEKIELYNSQGRKLETLSPRTCCPNGNRAHYNVETDATDIGNSAHLVVYLPNNFKQCRFIGDPTKRQE